MKIGMVMTVAAVVAIGRQAFDRRMGGCGGDKAVVVAAGRADDPGWIGCSSRLRAVCADRALDMVQKRFPKSEPRANLNSQSKAAEIKSVMLKDPNGINVQLGSVKYQL